MMFISADDMGLGKTLTMISLILKSNEMKQEEGSDESGSENCDESPGSNWLSSKRPQCKLLLFSRVGVNTKELAVHEIILLFLSVFSHFEASISTTKVYSHSFEGGLHLAK